MPVSDAKKKANARWNASKDNIMIRPTKEEGAAIRAAAIAAGQSNQQYILQATRERMAQEATGSPTRPTTSKMTLDTTNVGNDVLGPSEGRTKANEGGVPNE